MEKHVAGLIGAVSALVAAAPAQAATAQPVSVEAALQASSYADLLKPIPNALALLKTAAAVPAAPPLAPSGEAMIEPVQYHHHHHHHRRHYHHHHHHHHDGF
jgi:hypothetical protein